MFVRHSAPHATRAQKQQHDDNNNNKDHKDNDDYDVVPTASRPQLGSRIDAVVANSSLAK